MASEIEHEETRYLNLIRHILNSGCSADDRTGDGTIKVVGTQVRFSLSNTNKELVMPLITTKRTFWKGVAIELWWFITGQTDSKILADLNVHIWDGNSSREFLDKYNLAHFEEGDCGPIYGFQWRHWGVKYEGKGVCYEGKGVDQLANVIEQIKIDPESRRHIVTAWNPDTVPETPLPPCHFAFQFVVEQKKYLSCVVTMRSCDVGLGLPFNVASYALLTHIVAQITKLEAKEVIVNMADTHIYKPHIEALQQQIERQPFPFPTIKFKKEFKTIDDFKWDDVELCNYQSHPPIKMKMSI
jgi:thymidylate synthase